MVRFKSSISERASSWRQKQGSMITTLTQILDIPLHTTSSLTWRMMRNYSALAWILMLNQIMRLSKKKNGPKSRLVLLRLIIHFLARVLKLETLKCSTLITCLQVLIGEMKAQWRLSKTKAPVVHAGHSWLLELSKELTRSLVVNFTTSASNKSLIVSALIMPQVAPVAPCPLDSSTSWTIRQSMPLIILILQRREPAFRTTTTLPMSQLKDGTGLLHMMENRSRQLWIKVLSASPSMEALSFSITTARVSSTVREAVVATQSQIWTMLCFL